MSQTRSDQANLRTEMPGSLTCAECRSAMNREDQFCTTCGSQRQPLLLRLQEKTYSQNESGVLALYLENLETSLLPKVEISLECDEFVKQPPPQTKRYITRQIGQDLSFNFVPKRAGELLVRINVVTWDDQNRPAVFQGECIFYVHKEVNLESVTINAPKQTSKDQYGVDISGDVNIHLGSEPSRITEPSHQELKEEAWRDLPLHWSHEATKVLREANRQTSTGERSSQSETAGGKSEFKAACLRCTSDDQKIEMVIWLHFRTVLSLGKLPGQDIFCIVSNESGQVEDACSLISRKHLTIRVQEQGCEIEDHSLNGSRVGDRLIYGQRDRIYHKQLLGPADSFFLEYREFRDLTPLQRQASTTMGSRESIFMLSSVNSRDQQDLPLNAVRFGHVPDRLTLPSDHLVILKEVDVGSGKRNGLILHHPSVSPLHAKLVYQQKILRVVDLGSQHGTWVNDRQLTPYEGAVLGDGDRIRFGRVQITLNCLFEN